MPDKIKSFLPNLLPKMDIACVELAVQAFYALQGGAETVGIMTLIRTTIKFY
jgi:hypothetical protein